MEQVSHRRETGGARGEPPTLPATMQAVVCYGPHDYRLEERPVPRPGPEEVVVRVRAAGICASDLKCYLGAPLFWGDDRREGYCQPPVIPGHEFVGEVVALGEGASERYGLALGDLAISEQIVPCWSCRYCLRGQYWMCRQHDIYGFRQRTFGAMAEYMRFPRGALNYKVPPDLSRRAAALIEPLACSIHAVQRANIQFEDVVVIAGAGTLGLGMIVAARLKHPRLLISLDVSEARLAVARACGADLALNPSRVDVVDEVRKLTDGYGCDVYIEATGHPAAVEQGLHLLRKLGTFVEFSVMREPVTVDWTIIGDTKELNIYGAHLGPYCYPIAIELLSQGLVPAERIVTHEVPLAGFEHGIEFALGGEAIKVALVP
jgi:threonine dehydrogenase-like Zn-dependent dehydrogenase